MARANLVWKCNYSDNFRPVRRYSVSRERNMTERIINLQVLVSRRDMRGHCVTMWSVLYRSMRSTARTDLQQMSVISYNPGNVTISTTFTLSPPSLPSWTMDNS